ncbi:MAG TPA: pyrroloquinoline quinone biosynthesis peptide chaperone PqqD [Bacillales bacterium]|nr:pyrroloquinoline quinone biosynthesis peptide chaperone PqqD [Bacillales bacterium]
MDAILADQAPKLAPKARLKYDRVRETHLLLLPERVVALNETAASILALCDGEQTLHTIAKTLRASQQKNIETAGGKLPDLTTMEADIAEFVSEMADQGWVVIN